MMPGDRVIWLYSKKRSVVVGYRVQRVPGVVIRLCRRQIWLKIQLSGKEKLVKVSPENVICENGV